jgi:hypothetical protein
VSAQITVQSKQGTVEICQESKKKSGFFHLTRESLVFRNLLLRLEFEGCSGLTRPFLSLIGCRHLMRVLYHDLPVSVEDSYEQSVGSWRLIMMETVYRYDQVTFGYDAVIRRVIRFTLKSLTSLRK